MSVEAESVLRRAYEQYMREMTPAMRVGMELMGEEGFFLWWVDEMERCLRARLAKCAGKPGPKGRRTERQCRKSLEWIDEWKRMVERQK